MDKPNSLDGYFDHNAISEYSHGCACTYLYVRVRLCFVPAAPPLGLRSSRYGLTSVQRLVQDVHHSDVYTFREKEHDLCALLNQNWPN